MLKQRGIVIIATGHAFYGRMAYNLSVTVKASEPETEVAVLVNGAALSHLSERQRKLFDYIIPVESAMFSTKLELYKLSPFRKTIYLDADMVWLPAKKPSQLFDELDGVAFTCITEGSYDLTTGQDDGNPKYYFWADIHAAKDKYNLKGKLFQTRSEFLYFEKGKVAQKIFADAAKVYKNPKVDVKLFAAHVPDEFAFNIALCMNGIEPHKYKWTPAFWHRMHGEGRDLPSIMYEHYLLSVGGNYASGIMKDCYNKVCMAAHRKSGLQYLFTLQSKKSILAERKKM